MIEFWVGMVVDLLLTNKIYKKIDLSYISGKLKNKKILNITITFYTLYISFTGMYSMYLISIYLGINVTFVLLNSINISLKKSLRLKSKKINYI